MLAWIVFAATAPSLLCLGSAAWLAYKEKLQWMWFAGLAIVVGVGGIQMLATINAWRSAAH